MSKVQMLRAFVNQRLTLAAEEICELFERTIGEYEVLLCGQRKLLDAVLQPEIRLHRADVEPRSVSEREDPPERLEWIHSLDQEEPPELPHIKEEQEELWTSHEGEQLPGLEEADEEKPQSSQFHQRHTEQMKTEADGKDSEGSEQARSSDPDLQPDTDDRSSHSSSDSETDDSRDWEETREPRSGLKKNEGHQQKHNGLQTGVKPFTCSVCDKRYHRKNWLRAHMRLHSEGKRLSCSVCQKTFQWRRDVVKHMRIHTGEKPFSCSVCGTKFSQKEALSRHMKIHTEGEAVEVVSSGGLGRQRKRPNPETWKANVQKRRRMKGQSYLGRKNKETVLKEARQMGMPCQSVVCQKSSKLNCRQIDESKRGEIFKYFWEKLDWKERKIYVKSLVELSNVKRQRTAAEESRRSACRHFLPSRVEETLGEKKLLISSSSVQVF
uniref:zinc finger protein 135-like isoform X2 n=1 Tax=Scatophagus argus TaxID=75038 RepID=UPI001ED81232|nr:zinc finger protein 135-like isoform X2 [Scatophagus argus]